MQYKSYNDNADIVVGGGHLYIGKTSDITLVMPNVSTATVEEMNTYIDTLKGKMEEIALVMGGATIDTKHNYVDTKVQGETYAKFPATAEVTYSTSVAEINVKHLAEFVNGGTYTKGATSGIESFAFDGEQAPDECFLMQILEDKKTGSKYAYFMPRCQFSDSFKFDSDIEKQVTPDYTFTVLKPTTDIATATGIADYYVFTKIPADVSADSDSQTETQE